jgi:hypothetical protein
MSLMSWSRVPAATSSKTLFALSTSVVMLAASEVPGRAPMSISSGSPSVAAGRVFSSALAQRSCISEGFIAWICAEPCATFATWSASGSASSCALVSPVYPWAMNSACSAAVNVVAILAHRRSSPF